MDGLQVGPGATLSYARPTVTIKSVPKGMFLRGGARLSELFQADRLPQTQSFNSAITVASVPIQSTSVKRARRPSAIPIPARRGAAADGTLTDAETLRQLPRGQDG